MPKTLATALLVAAIAALVLSAGCTLATPGQPTPAPTTCCPCPTVSPTVTGGGGGGVIVVSPTATAVITVTGTGTATATRTATPTSTTTPLPGPGSVSGIKWNDLNGDHRRDAGEPVLANWTIRLEMQETNGPDWDEVARAVTGTDGAYSFAGLAEGHYRVYEVAQSGWTRTFPTNAEGMHNLVISNGQPAWTGQDFGNTQGAVVTLTATTTATMTVTASPTPTASVMPTATGSGGSIYFADVLTARNLAFDKTTFTVPAGATVALTFINDDPGVQHNFALYTDATATTPVFRGGIVTGQITTVYTFTAPSQPGTYFFRCDVHPTTMTGTFVVT